MELSISVVSPDTISRVNLYKSLGFENVFWSIGENKIQAVIRGLETASVVSIPVESAMPMLGVIESLTPAPADCRTVRNTKPCDSREIKLTCLSPERVLNDAEYKPGILFANAMLKLSNDAIKIALLDNDMAFVIEAPASVMKPRCMSVDFKCESCLKKDDKARCCNKTCTDLRCIAEYAFARCCQLSKQQLCAVNTVIDETIR